MKQFEFKPFDKVLVRNMTTKEWRADFYSHTDANGNHQCVSSNWDECIPYNEQTSHLIGTKIDYDPPKPKEWKVRSPNGMFVEDFTSDELLRFIETAVIQNKDIPTFSIMHIQ